MAWKLSDEAIKLAQETQAKYGVPASVTLGQFITESGAGTSNLFKLSNNGFGIIGSYNGQKVWYNDRYWRKYPSLAASFEDHGRLLSSGKYAEATKGAKTVDEYLNAILPIYAPSSDGNSGYPALLRKVIRDNNLTQYDTGVYSGSGGSASVSPVSTSGVSGSTSDIGTDILSAIIKVVFVGLLAVLAFVFFMTAFDEESPMETVKKARKKARKKKKGGKNNV